MEHAISQKTANATRNLERQQWKTTYDVSHSGIGPKNQYKLDNLQDKENHKNTHGCEDGDIVSDYSFLREIVSVRGAKDKVITITHFNLTFSLTM